MALLGGSIHDRIFKHWEFVESYILKDGHPFLSLVADGGIYEFAPIAGANGYPKSFTPIPTAKRHPDLRQDASEIFSEQFCYLLLYIFSKKPSSSSFLSHVGR